MFVFCRIQDEYDAAHTEDRLQNLTPAMLQAVGKYPKLRASAAQVRALVPIAHKLANSILDDDVPVEKAAKVGMFHLHQCYLALSHTSIFASAVLKEHSTLFALQYVALARLHEGLYMNK